MKKIIVGNWKMYGSKAMAESLVQAIADCMLGMQRNVDVVLCPPTPLIAPVAGWLASDLMDDKTLHIYVGGQDCHTQPEGAYTGDISASMLKDAGCSYVIVGHSERRLAHSENCTVVRKKAARAIGAGLTPIICVGETQAERAAGQTNAVIARQVADSLPDTAGIKGDGFANFILAYEPVWAIGSGKLPTPEEIASAHAAITAAASKRINLAAGLAPSIVCVLYGGSVKPANTREILGIAGVAGVLVGGASLKAKDFCAIIEAAE